MISDLGRRKAQYARKVTNQFAGTQTEPYVPEMIANFNAKVEAWYPKEQMILAILNTQNINPHERAAYYNFGRKEDNLMREGYAGDVLVTVLNAEKARLVALGLTATVIEDISLQVFGVPLV